MKVTRSELNECVKNALFRVLSESDDFQGLDFGSFDDYDDDIDPYGLSSWDDELEGMLSMDKESHLAADNAGREISSDDRLGDKANEENDEEEEEGIDAETAAEEEESSSSVKRKDTKNLKSNEEYAWVLRTENGYTETDQNGNQVGPLTFSPNNTTNKPDSLLVIKSYDKDGNFTYYDGNQEVKRTALDKMAEHERMKARREKELSDDFGGNQIGKNWKTVGTLNKPRYAQDLSNAENHVPFKGGNPKEEREEKKKEAIASLMRREGLSAEEAERKLYGKVDGEKKGRGRPRTRPLPDPNAPKKKRGPKPGSHRKTNTGQQISGNDMYYGRVDESRLSRIIEESIKKILELRTC